MDVGLPDWRAELPERLRTVGTDGANDIIDAQVIAALPVGQAEEAPADPPAPEDPGYNFLCYYEGFPQVHRVLRLQRMGTGGVLATWVTTARKAKYSWQITEREQAMAAEALLTSLQEAGGERDLSMGSG